MNNTHACLGSDTVDKVGYDKLTSAERQAVERHLSDCSSCRAMFAKTLDAPDWTDQILPVLIESSVSNSGSRAEGEAFQYESVRQLLGPSDDPSMLGRIGPYEVMGVIGAGGMGVVLKAFDRTLDRIVAIKMLLPHLAASSQARRRFSREGKAAAAVVDDHVLPIYGVDEWNGNPYLVTQYSNGMSLQKRIQDQGPLQLQEILRIAMQSARGLAAAHAQGIVHRDVKPSNILLDRTVERALLTDFGLARAADDASITRTGTIAGTPHYMSPEQVRNEPVDERSDLFSLGCTIYAMCTGRSPFQAESSYAVLRNITDASPRPVRSVNEEIPEWFECIVMRLLSKSSVDRFQSAEETADVLERCLAHVQNPSSSPLPDSVRQLVSRRQRPPWIGWIVASAAALVLFSAGVFILLEANKGTLTIKSDSDVPVRITQNDKPIKRFTVSKRTESVRLAVGTYTVEIDGQFDGIVVSGDKVVLRRGDQTTVEIKSSRSLDELASTVPIAEGGVAAADQSSPTQELIVDLFCGADTLPSINVPGRATQYVRMLEQLNAIEGLVVNFRVAGPGKQISKAVVRDLRMQGRRDVLASDQRSESQAAINAALRSAGVEIIEWTYGEGAPSATDTIVSSRALVLLMHPPHVADGNALQQAATSVALGQLAASDYLGVLTFAPGRAEWAWGGRQGLVQIGDRRAEMLQSIVDLKVTDTPEYDTALRLALAAFVDIKAADKRMLILTNGDPSLLNPEILNSFRDQGVTISVVHVTSYGDKYAAVPKRMTASTGGRYYRMDKVGFRPAMIEEIFRKESLTLDKQHRSKTGQQADQAKPADQMLRDATSNVDRTRSGETSSIDTSRVETSPVASRPGAIEAFTVYSEVVDDASLKAIVTSYPSLRQLSLISCQFKNESLRHLTRLPDLKLLDLSNSSVDDDGVRFVASLGSLKQLYLGSTQVTDVGMEHIAGMDSLEELNLTKTDVTNKGIRFLRGAKSLTRLNLSAMRFISDQGLKHVGGLTNLRSLDISYSDLAIEPITDSGMQEVSKLTRLERLRLHRTNITDAGLTCLATMNQLKDLELPFGVSNPTIRGISSLTNLERLVIPAAIMDDQGIADLAKLRLLKSLNLVVSTKGNVTDAGIRHLRALCSLRTLFLQRSSVTDDGLREIAKLPALESLTLNGNRISFEGLAHLQNASGLQHLSLSGLTGDFDLEHLRSLTELRSIDIGKHDALVNGAESDAILEPLSHLSKLERLDLDNVAISDASLRHVKGLRQLRWLFARHPRNNVTDAGLRYLSDLNKLESLCILGSITDQGLTHLGDLRCLKTCRLGTQTVSEKALNQLREGLPLINDLKTFHPTARRPLTEGLTAPDFKVSTLDGGELQLDDFAGKVLVLHFWATWCAPCVKQTPELKELYDKYRGNENFTIVSLSLDDAEHYARNHVKRNQLTWPQAWIGKESTMQDDYGVDSAPHYVVIGSDGIVRLTLSRNRSTSRIELMNCLDELLAEKVK